MSAEHISPLHNRLHVRFHEVFGKPSNSLGRDDHWSLYPKPNRPSINVLVNGQPELPVVWVFDPHDHADGVMRVAVKDEDHLDEVIAQIQKRLQRAAAQAS